MPSARPLKVGQTKATTLPDITESNDLVNGKQEPLQAKFRSSARFQVYWHASTDKTAFTTLEVPLGQRPSWEAGQKTISCKVILQIPDPSLGKKLARIPAGLGMKTQTMISSESQKPSWLPSRGTFVFFLVMLHLGVLCYWCYLMYLSHRYRTLSTWFYPHSKIFTDQ